MFPKTYLGNNNSRRRRCYAALLALILTLFIYLNHLHFSSSLNFTSVKSNNFKSAAEVVRCPPPSVQVWNSDLVPYYEPSKAVNCTKEFNHRNYSGVVAFTLNKGNQLKQLVPLNLSCCYRALYRTANDSYSITDNCTAITRKTTEIPSTIHYIAVECSSKPGKTNVLYRDAFPLVHRIKPKPEVPGNSSEPQLNVLIIGFDGVSQLNFIRRMPHSSKYLTRTLGAVSLKGYSITGHGTTTNLIPMLYGVSKAEVLANCKDSHIDLGSDCTRDTTEYPLIWRLFSSRGYLTTYAEDTGNLHWGYGQAFKTQPTDYYLRPYYLFMNQFSLLGVPLGKCFGPRLALDVILNFVEAVRQEAKMVNRPYFQFTFSSKLAHDGFNELTGDEILLRYLKLLKTSGAMNSTVLMMLGDHGSIYTGYYGTPSGNLEYRMPVAYIAMPSWFQKRYPREYLNLLDNRKKMTTSHDIYKTLRHILNLNSWKGLQGTGISLFDPIPQSRKCSEAGTPLRWCILCHPKVPLKANDPLLGFAANFVVSILNKITSKKRAICQEQTLRNISSRGKNKWDYRDISLELCNVHGAFDAGADTVLTKMYEISCNGNDTVDIVNVQVTTNPTGAVYFAEVMMAWKQGEREEGKAPYKMIPNGEPVRWDVYSKTGSCVAETAASLRPYCICKGFRNKNK